MHHVLVIGPINCAASLQFIIVTNPCSTNTDAKLLRLVYTRARGVYNTLSAPLRSRSCRLWFSNALMIFSNIVGEATAFLICCRVERG
jgi:hypothetical protein